MSDHLSSALRRAFAVLCIGGLWPTGVSASAAETKHPVIVPNRTIRVGLYPQEGFHDYQNGQPVSGYGYDYLQHLRQYAPWTYQYSGEGKGWLEVMQMLYEGKIDLMTNVRKTPEREKRFAFSRIPMGRASTILTVKSGDTRYRSGDYPHWNGIRIGIPRSSTMRKAMADFADRHGFAYTEVAYDGLAELLRDLHGGTKIDAALTSNLRRLHNEWLIEQLDVTPFYIAVRKDNKHLLAELDAAMARLELNDPALQSSMWKMYFAESKTRSVQYSEDEMDFIRDMNENGKTFTAVLNPDRYPISYFADGRQRGYIKEIADEIIRRTGLKIRFLPVKTPEEYQAACKNPAVDFVFDVKHRLCDGERNGLVLSRPYVSLSSFLLVNRAAEARPKSYVLIEGYRIAEPLKTQLPPDVKIRYCKTTAEAIALVASGKYDATCLHTSAAELAARSDSRDRLTTKLLPKLKIDLAAGTRDNRNPLLASVINKSVASLGDDYVMEVVRKYEPPRETSFSIMRMAHRHPFAAFGIPLFLLLIFCGFLVRLLKQRKAAYRFGFVLKNLPFRYFFADAGGRLLQYDYGSDPNPPLLRTLDDVKDDGIRIPVKKLVREVLDTGKIKEISYADNGKDRLCMAAPVPDSLFGRPAVIGVSRDISELRKSRDEARNNAEFFSRTLQSIGDGVIATDAKGDIIVLNPVAERMMGVRLADVIGKPHTGFFKIQSSEDNSELESPVLRTLRTGDGVEPAAHTDLISVNGKDRRHVAAGSAPIIGAAGKVIGAILVFRDVTGEYNRRMEMTNEIANREATARIAKIYHFVYDPRTGRIHGNPQISEVWPIRDGKTIPPEEWLYPEDLPAWQAQYSAVAAGKQQEATVAFRVLQDGKMRHFRGFMRGTGKPDGTITGILQEQTTFVEAEQKQNALQTLWSTCLDYMPLVLFIKSIDDDFRYLQCNKRYAGFIGRSVEEIVGHTDAEILTRKEDIPYIRRHDQQAAAAKGAITLLETLADGDGQIRHFQTIKFRTMGFDGKTVMVCMALDVTEDYNRQQKIDALLEDWENVANVANIGSYRLDSDMNPLTATERMAKFWPIGKNGKPLTPEEYLIPEDAEEYKKIYASVFGGKRDQASMLCRVPEKEGMRYLRLFIKRNAKRANVVSGLLQDVTSMIREQQRREALLKMWTNVVDTLPVLFFVKNADDEFRYLQVNANFSRLLGLTPRDVVGRLETELIPNPEEAEKNLNEDRLTMKSGTRQKFIEQLQLRDGGLRHFRTVKIPSVDEDGRNILIAMSQDVTDEEELSAARKIITSAFETLFSSDNLEKDMRLVMKKTCRFIGFDRAYIGCVDESNNNVKIFSAYRPEGAEVMLDLNTFRIEQANTLSWYINLLKTAREDAFNFDFSNERDRQLARHHVPTLLKKAEEFDIRGVRVNYIAVNGKPWAASGSSRAAIRRNSSPDTRICCCSTLRISSASPFRGNR